MTNIRNCTFDSMTFIRPVEKIAHQTWTTPWHCCCVLNAIKQSTIEIPAASRLRITCILLPKRSIYRGSPEHVKAFKNLPRERKQKLYSCFVASVNEYHSCMLRLFVPS